jgi:hypothetical protein
MVRAPSSEANAAAAATPSNAAILDSCRVPPASSVYVLGCLEKRVTLYSQQVRAINLAVALVDEGLAKPGSSVAIIGAGAAGLTAAAALAIAEPKLKAVHIYERKPEKLHLQRSSPHRYLHPHIYDWPEVGSLRPDAGLPLLTWSVGTAEQVAEQLETEFDRVAEQYKHIIDFRPEQHVEEVLSFPFGKCRVRLAGNDALSSVYDIAILSVGFGNELLTDGEINHSYWDPSRLIGPLRGNAKTFQVLVSGNGDGGLVDFATAAFNGSTHTQIAEFITQRTDLEDAKRVLLEIEDDVWGQRPKLDIYEAYRARVKPCFRKASGSTS